jgi:D-xylose transport system permease protein
MSTGTTSAVDLPEAGATGGIGQAVRDYIARVRGGDIGSLPAVLGLVVLVALFGILETNVFLSTLNFANLLNQGAAIIVLAMGLIFVLLLGEIDLSAGFAAGTAAAVMAVTLNSFGWAWPLTLVAAIATGVVIGLVIGLLVARLGIPSFVVTLAAFLGLQGVMLWIIGEGGTIPIRDEALLLIMNKNMPVLFGWILWALVTGLFGLVTLLKIIKRRRLGLTSEAISVWLIKVVSLGVLLGAATFILNLERQRPNAKIIIQGVPWVVPLIIALLVVLTFVTTRTAFGRHIYAVGGNAEAARRAGISVSGVKVACFILCSSLAALAGVLIASRDNSVSPTTGGAQTLLFAVGAAVIGGTSLFGGRGKIRDAIIGGLVIAVIANGLPLVTEQSAVQFIVTGLVLLLAASVDAISRRRSAAAGR